MSSSVGRSTYGTLDRLLASVGTLQDQRTVLQQQTVTGKVAQSYAGLASKSAQVLNLSATTSRSDAYTQAISQAQGKAAVMQDALSRIGTVVNDLAAKTLTLTGSTQAGAVEGVAQEARLAFAQIASLLNTTYAGDYVFAGADTANAPVPSPDTVTTAAAGMFMQIRSQVASLATVPTTPAVGTIIANTVTIAASTAAGTTIFSPYLTGATVPPPTTVQIGDTERVSLDLLANRNSIPTTAGAGGAINDILRSLAVVANSTAGMSANPDFATLMKDAAATLTSAGTALTVERGRIGVTQNVMTAAAEGHASMKLILSTQLSSLTDVDMADAISRLQAVKSQLEASYNVLSMARSLNLSSYL